MPKGTIQSKLKCAHKHLIALFVFIGFAATAQNDTIRLANNDVLVGEIKSISRGILIIETSYSDSDFKVETDKLISFNISKKCIVTLTNDRRYFGELRSEKPGTFTLALEDGGTVNFKLDELIELLEISDDFWKRFIGGFDLGFNFTKASNNLQFTIAGYAGFTSQKWRIQTDINFLESSQDSVANVQRTDASIETLRLLPRNWYLLADAAYLSNTEQALTARISPSLGVGKFVINTNKLYLGVSLGATYNIERYEDITLNKNSAETFIGSNFNMYDFKDFKLQSSVKFYLSLTEKGRVRTDYSINIKYDLPWDFYIKTEFTLNFDNQPAVSGRDLDYIFSTGFGFKFD